MTLWTTDDKVDCKCNKPVLLAVLGLVGAFRHVLEQDTELQIAPDEQLMPWMAASAISM